MATFYEAQKLHTLKAGTALEQSSDAVLKLTGELLKTIGNHPSLMESTYEYNEDIQNAVNNLADAILVPRVS